MMLDWRQSKLLRAYRQEARLYGDRFNHPGNLKLSPGTAGKKTHASLVALGLIETDGAHLYRITEQGKRYLASRP